MDLLKAQPINIFVLYENSWLKLLENFLYILLNFEVWFISFQIFKNF